MVIGTIGLLLVYTCWRIGLGAANGLRPIKLRPSLPNDKYTVPRAFGYELFPAAMKESRPPPPAVSLRAVSLRYIHVISLCAIYIFYLFFIIINSYWIDTVQT